MRVVGVTQSKGGVGKSTIAVNIARTLQLRGRSVALVDCDAQGTARSWKASRSDGAALPPITAVERAKDLAPALRDLPPTCEIAVVDGAAQMDHIHAEIIKAADLALVPITPSPLDVWATEGIVRLVKRRQESGVDLAAAFVVSRRKAGTKLGDAVQQALGRFDLPVWEGTCDRVAYPQSMGQGLGAVEYSDAKAAAEVNELTNRVETALQL